MGNTSGKDAWSFCTAARYSEFLFMQFTVTIRRNTCPLFPGTLSLMNLFLCAWRKANIHHIWKLWMSMGQWQEFIVWMWHQPESQVNKSDFLDPRWTCISTDKPKAGVLWASLHAMSLKLDSSFWAKYVHILLCSCFSCIHATKPAASLD